MSNDKTIKRIDQERVVLSDFDGCGFWLEFIIPISDAEKSPKELFQHILTHEPCSGDNNTDKEYLLHQMIWDRGGTYVHSGGAMEYITKNQLMDWIEEFASESLRSALFNQYSKFEGIK